MADCKLILNDGTELEESQCGYAEHRLWCYIKGLTLAEAFAVFSDPEKTQTIRFQYGSVTDTYIGFTEIDLIRKSELTVDVRLTGGTMQIEEDSTQESDEDVRDGSET